MVFGFLFSHEFKAGAIISAEDALTVVTKEATDLIAGNTGSCLDKSGWSEISSLSLYFGNEVFNYFFVDTMFIICRQN